MVQSRVTIRDIAARAGVHYSTVSLALRNNPRLPADTRNKIQQLAQDLGYSPDPMVAALNAYRHARALPRYKATIAWVNNWRDRYDLLRVPEFNEYYEGASDRAKERGYVLEEFWLRERGMSAKAANQIFRARNIRGVLIAPQEFPQDIIPFAYDQLSGVALGYSMHPASLHVVTNHHLHTMRLILTHLHNLGYRRVGVCINPSWDKKVENAWIGGGVFWNWQNSNALQIIECPEGVPDEQLAEQFRRERIQAIIGDEPVCSRIRRMGFKVPNEIGFVGVALRRDETSVSGTYQNDLLVGRQAIDLIIDMVHRGERGIPAIPIRTLVESTWFPGKTLRAVNADPEDCLARPPAPRIPKKQARS